MKKNMGIADRVIRILLAIAVIVFICMGTLTGITAIVLGVFAAIFLLTSLINFCPLYMLLGLSTCPAKKR